MRGKARSGTRRGRRRGISFLKRTPALAGLRKKGEKKGVGPKVLPIAKEKEKNDIFNLREENNRNHVMSAERKGEGGKGRELDSILFQTKKRKERKRDLSNFPGKKRRTRQSGEEGRKRGEGGSCRPN